jgi:hypothetical protein
MDKHLRIWVDGQLEVETSVAEDELPLDSFSSRWQEAVALQPSEASRGGLNSEIRTPT